MGKLIKKLFIVRYFAYYSRNKGKAGVLCSLSVEGQILDMMTRILDVFSEKDTGAGAVVHPHRAAAAAAQKARFRPSKIVMIF